MKADTSESWFKPSICPKCGARLVEILDTAVLEYESDGTAVFGGRDVSACPFGCSFGECYA